MSQDALKQYRYHIWANKRVFDHLQQLPEGTEEREVESVFPSILTVLAHIYSVDAMWFSVMRGDSFSETLELVTQIRNDIKNKNLAEVKELFQTLEASLTLFFSEKNLDHPVPVEHPKYGKNSAPLSELIQHVVNHGTYHRGNITAMLHQLGHKGVPTDYVFYLFEAQ